MGGGRGGEESKRGRKKEKKKKKGQNIHNQIHYIYIKWGGGGMQTNKQTKILINK